MTVHRWIRIAPGVALYRESPSGTWLLDVRVEKRRVRMSTRTKHLPKAVQLLDPFVSDPEYVDRMKNAVKNAEQFILTQEELYKDLSAAYLRASAQRAQLQERILEDRPVSDANIERVVKKCLELEGRPPRILSVKEAITFTKALEGHLANIKAGTSTSEKYQKQIPGWVQRFVGQAGVKTVGEVTRNHLNNHVTWLRTPSVDGGAGLSPKTVYNVKGGLKEFFAFCLSEKWIAESPAEHLKLGKIPKPGIRFFLASEIDAVLACGSKAYEVDTVATFATACFAGPRLEEIHSLDRDHIHLERRKFEIWDNKRKQWKVSPVFDCLVPHLEALLSSSRGPRPFAKRSLGAMGASLSRLVKRALPEKELLQHDAGGERVDAALTCRRTFSTHLRALGVSDRVVAKWSGHDPVVDSSTYCGTLPDGERAYPIKFLEKDLIPEGLPCSYPEPSILKKVH